MKRLLIRDPVTGLPLPGTQAVQIIGKNKRRVGLVINNTGTQTAFLYSNESMVNVATGYPIPATLGVTFLSGESCPQTPIWAGQGVAGAILNIMEIVTEEG